MDIKELKELNLPPNTVHIQIRIPTEKDKNTLNAIKNYLDKNVKYFEVKNKIQNTIHIILDKEKYNKNSIIFYLKSLPKYIKIEVDSRNLL